MSVEIATPAGRPGRLESLSIVMPAWNEGGNIDIVIAEAIAAGARHAQEFEVIVVDDGSTDATALRLQAAAASERRLVHLHHDQRRGYGAALRTGLGAATMHYVLLCDADRQFDFGDLGRLLEPLQDCAVVIGYRHDRRDDWRRRLLGACWTRLQRQVFGLEVRDVNCAFKLFRRDILARMSLQSNGAFLPAEILIRTMRAGHAIAEVPVRHLPRVAGRASGSRVDVIATALADMWRFRHTVREP